MRLEYVNVCLTDESLNRVKNRLVPSSSVGQALGSHYGKKDHLHNIVLFTDFEGKIAIIGIHKRIQMSNYPSKGVFFLLAVQCS